MNRWLFHPHVTLAATLTGLVAVATLCAGVIGALGPLASIHGLEAIKPVLDRATLVLGVIAAVCTALAGVGRSFASAVDNDLPADRGGVSSLKP
ncbi:MAG: hypothetical protein ACREP1_11830 [Rhodanobacteraceae bacterium]